MTGAALEGRRARDVEVESQSDLGDEAELIRDMLECHEVWMIANSGVSAALLELLPSNPITFGFAHDKAKSHYYCWTT